MTQIGLWVSSAFVLVGCSLFSQIDPSHYQINSHTMTMTQQRQHQQQ